MHLSSSMMKLPNIHNKYIYDSQGAFKLQIVFWKTRGEGLRFFLFIDIKFWHRMSSGGKSEKWDHNQFFFVHTCILTVLTFA